mmetsp:Transcript_13807/g.40528  ORF Transcript_13807/g.40528 Transcript_13807/m.40528 type:complete len:204 (-) Transcript_13807:3-614(-)
MCGSDARALEPLSKRKCLATAREPRPLSARELDARVHRHDAAGEVAVAHEAEAGIARQVRELLLRVELLDALDEVLVRRAVVGHQPSHCGDDVEGVPLVEAREEGVGDVRKLETEEAPARPQHAMGLAQRLLDVRHVSDPKGNRVHIKRAVVERQLLRRPNDPVHPRSQRGRAAVKRAPPPLLEHRLVDVAHHHPRLLDPSSL